MAYKFCCKVLANLSTSDKWFDQVQYYPHSQALVHIWEQG